MTKDNCRISPRSAIGRACAGFRRIVLSTALLGAASGATAWAEVTVAPAARGYDIDITGQASSTELIDAIAAALGIKVQGYPADSTVTANQLRGASLERALRALLPTARFVVRFNDDDTPEAIIFLSASKDGEMGNDPDLSEDIMLPNDAETYDPAEPPEPAEGGMP